MTVAVRAAVALLTRLPMQHPLADATGAAAFPLIGAGIGLLGGLVCLAIGGSQPTLAALVAVGAMALASGGLHLDGLADTADALATADPVRAEAARKDPAIGSGGVVALIIVIGAQVAALAAIAGDTDRSMAAGACVAAATISRAVLVLGAWLVRSHVREDGFGAWFAERITFRDVIVASGLAAVIVATVGVIVASSALVAGVAIASLGGVAVLGWITWRRDALDGDGLGASAELTMAMALGAVALLV